MMKPIVRTNMSRRVGLLRRAELAFIYWLERPVNKVTFEPVAEGSERAIWTPGEKYSKQNNQALRLKVFSVLLERAHL